MAENMISPIDIEEEGELAYSDTFSPTMSVLVPAVLLAVTTPFASSAVAKRKYVAPQSTQAVEVTFISTPSAAYEESIPAGEHGEKMLSAFVVKLLEGSQETPRDIAEAINSRLFDLL